MPKPDSRKDGALQIRVTPEQKAAIAAAAAATGLPVSAWSRMILLRAAQKPEE